MREPAFYEKATTVIVIPFFGKPIFISHIKNNNYLSILEVSQKKAKSKNLFLNYLHKN